MDVARRDAPAVTALQAGRAWPLGASVHEHGVNIAVFSQHAHRFNPNKLLLDPWAREIVAPPDGFDWSGPHFGADREHPQHLDTRDNGALAFKARVVGPEPGVARLRTPPGADTLIYELHVRGFTRQMPGVPEPLRGTYAGLAHDAAIAHLQRLGVTTVCLLPVQQHLDEAHLAARGLRGAVNFGMSGFVFNMGGSYATADG